MRRTSLLAIMLASIVFCAVAQETSSPKIMSENKVPGRVERTARRLMHQLNKEGFEVARGYFKLYTDADCNYSYAVMNTCYGNNPAAPYIIPVLPWWPDEWLDPMMANVFGPTQDGYRTTFRLDPKEAIVILGQLPPPAKYFGLQPYVFTRQGQFNTDSDQYKYVESIGTLYPVVFHMLFAYVPWDHNRIQLLASLGNSINNVVIQNASGAAFNRERYFIITPDQVMENVVRHAFRDVGVEGKDIFTEPISSLVWLGLDKAADDFFAAIRYAMPEDANQPHPASEVWRQDLPLVVLRIRDRRTDRPPLPYEPVKLDARSKTQPPEIALAPDLTSLVKAVCQRWEPSCNYSAAAPFMNLEAPRFLMVGPKCIAAGMDCLADTQDTVYYMSPQVPLYGNLVYAVVGALSTETGNATYVGLGINTSTRQLGIDNVSDSDLKGSADAYWSAVAAPEKFFVYYFAVDCTKLEPWASGFCRSIPYSERQDYDPTHPTLDQIGFSLRDYMFPGTDRGPDAEFTLSPYVIAVQGP